MTPLQRQTLRELRALGIRYLVVGGQAMRAMGIDRQTRDLDLWIARDAGNARAMARFLQRVQYRVPLARLQEPNLKLTVGDPRHPEVDLLTSVAGDPNFADCFCRSQQMRLDGHRLQIVAAADLLAIKEASAQTMDHDAQDANLSDQERAAAVRTAEKERRDVALLAALINPGQ